jgi:hypothetical protein
MKIRKLQIAIGLAAVVLMGVTSARANLTIDYNAGGWGPINFAADTLSMQAFSGSGLVLPDNTAVTAQINTLLFNVGDSGPFTGTDNFTASRLLTITAPALGGQNISQNGALNVTTAFDFVDIQNGLPIVFSFPGIGTVTVTPLAFSTGPVGISDNSYDINGSFLFTPVPESTTMIAGALLLLPFGVSTLRILRKNRTA